MKNKSVSKLDRLLVVLLDFIYDLWEQTDFQLLDFLDDLLKQFGFSQDYPKRKKGKIIEICGASGGYGSIWFMGDRKTAMNNMLEMIDLLKRQQKLQAFK